MGHSGHDLIARLVGQMESTCRNHGGEVFLGEAAWIHITEQASPTVRTCIERYCRDPLALMAAEQSGAA